MTRPRVRIACCNGTGWLHKLVAFAAFEMLKDDRVEATFTAPTRSPFVANLHATVHEFLELGDDFLLLMDDDNPPKNNPLDLVFLDLDVVGLPTPVWHSGVDGDRPWYLNAMVAVGDGFRPLQDVEGRGPEGLREVDAVGGGCVLIARRVLEDLVARAGGDPLRMPFMRRWDSRGLPSVGNDYAFCVRAREAGWRVWAHFDYGCEHLNELPLREAIGAMNLAAVRRG